MQKIQELWIVFITNNPFSAVLAHGRHGRCGALESLSGIEKLLEVLAFV
jgi:hypothetical protein